MSRFVIVLGCALFCGLTSQASAQTYPTRDITFLCAFPPGSAPDVLVRYFADKLRPVTQRNIIVQNRAGAGGNIAAETLIKSKPDGHTIYLHAGTSLALNAFLIKNNPVDGPKHIRIAATIHKNGFVIIAPGNSPHKSIKDLTEAMKAKGARATFATTAPFGTLMGSVYRKLAGLEAVEVKFKLAADASKEMQSGEVDYGVFDPLNARRMVNMNGARILAISTSNRMQSLSDVPTMKESGFDVDMNNWFAAMVPMGTPEPIINQINAWFGEVLKTEDTAKFLDGIGSEVWIATPTEGQTRLTTDLETWRRYVTLAGMQAE